MEALELCIFNMGEPLLEKTPGDKSSNASVLLVGTSKNLTLEPTVSLQYLSTKIPRSRGERSSNLFSLLKK
ncbi:hypothetical protein Bca101_027615 [Brassica carinata]